MNPLLTSLFALLLATAAGAAELPTLKDGSFENSPFDHWYFNHGGEGGGRSGADVLTPPNNAHTGTNAALLSVGPATRHGADVWSTISQHFPVEPRTRLHITAHIACPTNTTATNSIFQLRIEYFTDTTGLEPVTHHLRMTSDLPLAQIPPGPWKKIELTDTVPTTARTAILSLILLGRGPIPDQQRLWADEITLQATPRKAPTP